MKTTTEGRITTYSENKKTIKDTLRTLLIRTEGGHCNVAGNREGGGRRQKEERE